MGILYLILILSFARSSNNAAVSKTLIKKVTKLIRVNAAIKSEKLFKLYYNRYSPIKD